MPGAVEIGRTKKMFRETTMRLMLQLTLLIFYGPLFAFDHSDWDALLEENVAPLRGGVATAVDYAAIGRDQERLDAYLESLSDVSIQGFKDFSRDEKLAFLINAYNAYTIKLILLEDIPDSIRDIGNFLSGPWDKEFIVLLGKARTLDEIEHEMIRGNPELMDPRIHFAVNCASIGCPALRPEAYTADKLDAQLEDSTRKFLSDKKRNRYNSERKALEISKIFDWYEDDFEDAAGSLAAYLLPYAEELGVPQNKRKQMKDDDMTIRHLDYDWALNKQ